MTTVGQAGGAPASVAGFGVDYETGRPTWRPTDLESFAGLVGGYLATRPPDLGLVTEAQVEPVSKAELRPGGPDPFDPRQAGWAYVVHAGEPDQEGLVAALRPLAEERGMRDPTRPVSYDGTSDPFTWVNQTLRRMEPPPAYVLLVGDADRLPFSFQAALGTVASVGRLWFDGPDGRMDLDRLRGYVGKLLDLEERSTPAASNDVLLFAPEWPPNPQGRPDATHWSRTLMVGRLHELVQAGHPTYRVETIEAEAATRDRLLRELRSRAPALLYTASHGFEVPARLGLGVQRRFNGAICCQRESEYAPRAAFALAGEDIGPEPFTPGGFVFQFACFGYGTPSTSLFAHLRPDLMPYNAERDFVAALPQRLLGHPQGPIGFISHVDPAFLHGFVTDPSQPGDNPWSGRMQPFEDAVEELLWLRPIGYALRGITGQLGILNDRLAELWDDQRRDPAAAPAATGELVDLFITRNDARSFLLLGDPGAKLRVEVPD